MPSPSRIVLVAASLLATSSAQTDGDKATVWGSVLVLNNGERTPISGFPTPVLTPQGAIQMRFQGDAFRRRYLVGSDGQSDNITDSRPIRNLERDAINNAHLSVTSLATDYIVAGAAAFMQGLYPPNRDALLASHGGEDLSINMVTNENVSYPLSGYQYPAIETVTIFDEHSIALQGHFGCDKWLLSSAKVQEDSAMQAFASNTSATYRSLFARPVFNGTFPEYKTDFFHSYELWDYVRYQQVHNRTVHDEMGRMTDASSILGSLEDNARVWQLALYADARVSGVSTAIDRTVRTIAGRTLARAVLDGLDDIIDGAGEPGQPKLVAMFTSFPPLLSFFALAGLRTSETDVHDDFFGLPQPGAAMAFELVGDQPGAYGQFPDEDHLWVRFVWRRDTASDTSFRAVPLFRNPKSEYVLPWVTFRNRMRNFATTGVTDWCNMCGADAVTYCRARQSSSGSGAAVGEGSSGGSGSGSGGGVRDPVVAGVIGAVVTLAVIGLVAAAAALFGGVRMYRRSKGDGDANSKRGLGGFKGAEKMASDADLSLGRGGVRHERMGSWELRSGDVAGAASTTAAAAADTTPTTRSADGDDVEPATLGAGLSFHQALNMPRARPAVDDDGVSALSADIGTAPVRPRESI